MAGYKYMMRVEDVMQDLSCSRSYAYKGIEPMIIKERLGHKDIKITLNTYGHLYPSTQRKVADMLDEHWQIQTEKRDATAANRDIPDVYPAR